MQAVGFLLLAHTNKGTENNQHTPPSNISSGSPLPTTQSLISPDEHSIYTFTIYTIFPDSSSLTTHILEPEMAPLVF